MKTLNVYFHAVHFLNKPTMFFIKKKTKFNRCLWYMEICSTQYNFLSSQKVTQLTPALCRSDISLQANSTTWSSDYFTCSVHRGFLKALRLQFVILYI